ncbi:hypothetical protein [Pantoea sp. C2G6]|uniref:hypothetical protein n=1 Tax=Pantoea sp. C2G6 TaxID=3243084 RepID=UPI003EDA2F7A
MENLVISNIDKLIAAFESNPIYIGAAIVFIAVVGFIRWLTKNIKAEHLFQHTISNKLRFIKNELKDGVIGAHQQKQLEKCYENLLNQKIYGVKNSFIQREVINIIDNSSQIKNFKYFSIYQYVLDVDSDGKLFFSEHKIKVRFVEALLLLAIGLLMLCFGFWIISLGLMFGLLICLLGMVFYFGGLGHFPASRSMRKQAEKEIANYYQHSHVSEMR